MADTGWLVPAASSIVSIPASIGNPWLRVNNLSQYNNRATDSWGSFHAGSGQYNFASETLGFDWVVPDGLYPENAVIVGMEVGVWAYRYQHAYTTPVADCGITSLRSGWATVESSTTENAQQIFRIPDPGSFPDDSQTPPSAAHFLAYGGPTNIFDLAVGTRVFDFFNQSGVLFGGVSRQTGIRVGVNGGSNLSDETAFYLSHARIKLYYEVPAEEINMESSPSVVTSILGTIAALQDMNASPEKALSIPGNTLGSVVELSASPLLSLDLPADISEGYVYIDSTCFPYLEILLESPSLQLIRNKDLSASPTIDLSILASGVGKRIDMSSSPAIAVTLPNTISGSVDMQIEENGMVVQLTIPNTYIELNSNLHAAPFKHLSIEAKLEGDIYLGSECEEFQPVISLTIDADLGYTKGLDANPSIFLTMDVDGLVVGTALEFSPLISLTIPKVNLRNKYAEPAPDHRTYFLCPEDRTIVITRKDKTIL